MIQLFMLPVFMILVIATSNKEDAYPYMYIVEKLRERGATPPLLASFLECALTMLEALSEPQA
eukprot:8601717-Pyramimonas_sp.AAC.1